MLLQYFAILGRNDTPLYELDINYAASSSTSSHSSASNSNTGATQSKLSSSPANSTQMKQFLLHSSLDTLDHLQYASLMHLPQQPCYIKSNPIERYQDSTIYAYVTCGFARMLVLCSDTEETMRTERMIFGSSGSRASMMSGSLDASGHADSSAAKRFSSAASALTASASHDPTSSTTPQSTRNLSQNERKRFEEALKAFFNEVHEYYVAVCMNPFYEMDTPITAKHFDSRVRELYQKYLR